MELIVISNPFAVVDENIIINNLFQAGLKYFHIRKPESDIQTVKELLNGIAPCFYERIALHQFHEMASDFGINRLHYTERARDASGIKKWQDQLTEGFTLSTSVHDITLLPTLEQFEYTFYGPVFNSISKPGYQSNLSRDFKLDRSDIKTKVIALGGITVPNLSRITAMGFDGAAVLGILWNEPDKAVKRYNQLKETLPD
jgi:thiamine-phosphate pyrophosphorylase